MEVGKKFKNINSYNNNMSKHIEDKLFWLDKFSDKRYNIVDFGCADGAIINYLCNKEKEPLNTYIGYDISETMIKIAKSNFNGSDSDDVIFTSSWDKVKEVLEEKKRPYKINILFLSSVIHEVYSYSKSTEEIDDFWSKVFDSDFDYIIVRDMMVTYDTYRYVSSDDLKKLYNKKKYGNQIAEFEEKHGSCKIVMNFMHFLLKYRWKINWEREVNEDYFPITVEDFLELMESDYNIDYLERFRVPFLDKEIKKDFDITLKDFTHIKVIFSKKKENFAVKDTFGL